MQQKAAMKFKACRHWLQAASCNKMLMKAATVVQVLQDFVYVVWPDFYSYE